MSITTAGNKHGPRLLYQIPIVCPSPDQTAWVLVDEVIPLFEVLKHCYLIGELI